MWYAELLLSFVTATASPLERFDAQVEAAYPGTPSISAAELLASNADHPSLLVDARTPEERAVSTLPGAITPEALLRSEPASERRVVVYCTIGMRSADMTLQLRAKGWNAFNLRGGVLAWAAAGGTFVAPNGSATRRVHVYGRRWNHLPDDFEAVW